MTAPQLAYLAEQLIATGKKRCSGHVLILDAHTITRVITEALAGWEKVAVHDRP